MLDSIWMTKSSPGFVLVFSAIYSKTQISLFSCTISFHWPPWPIFAVFGHLSKLEMICINYLAMSVHPHYEVQWSYHSNYPGCVWFHLWFSFSRCFCCCFGGFICGGFHFNILRIQVDESWCNLQYYCLRESHRTTIPCSLIFCRSPLFSGSPGYFTWRLWRFSNLCWLLFLVRFLYIQDGWFVPSG